MEDIALEQKRERTKSICFAMRMDFAQPSRLAISQPVTLTTGLPGQVRPSRLVHCWRVVGEHREITSKELLFTSVQTSELRISQFSPLCAADQLQIEFFFCFFWIFFSFFFCVFVFSVALADFISSPSFYSNYYLLIFFISISSSTSAFPSSSSL